MRTRTIKKDQEIHDYVVHDLLGAIEGITSRAMFGGWGIYKDGIIFAIIADGELYFKVGDTNKADFESRGSHPFVYEGAHGKKATMSYWLVPEEIMENPEVLREWMDNALMVSASSEKKRRDHTPPTA